MLVGVVLDNDWRMTEGTTLPCVNPVQSELARCVVREQRLEEELECGAGDVRDSWCCARAQSTMAVTREFVARGGADVVGEKSRKGELMPPSFSQ